ncbi:MAG TPA: asparagine synthase (glutamine-hydrolyzing) [Bryobacteraceae bacterium]|nr:asparagine synthase (glutamine-hydrolyzing) [Bryobacteraceae bacterium]
MCGIAGFTHSRRAAEPGRIAAITRSITHRGPDQQGVWESDHVSLGAVRLKIIDLEHGAQPMVRQGPGGDTVLVFNGEIYNHAEIRRELEHLGHRFESRCDTEVLLRAFLEWDLGSLQKLRGMFAAAWWTESSRRLVLVRDRMGIKPLYFARRAGEIYFGSELKTILLHPEIERRIDPEGLGRYLSMNYAAGTHTLVEGIEKLAPGHWLEWVASDEQEGRVRSEAYWRIGFRPDSRIDLESAKQELDRLLRDSVREHLIADVPLGVWSSGGLDSSTILHYAAEASPAKLKTFSVSFHGREFDESHYFREVAAKYGTDHHEFDLNPDQGLAETIEQFAYYSDEPSADAGALPVWFLSKMCRSEVTVALSGDGADELFGGYNTYLADRYACALRVVPRSLRRAAVAAARMLPVSDRKIGLDYKITRMMEGSLLDPVEAHFFWNGTFSAEQKSRLTKLGGAQPIELPGEGAGYLNRFLWLDQLYYLPDDILYKCDRMSMAHSLELRPPFLDHRIVEFAAALPENLKIRGTRLKFLLRELMRNRLPAGVIARSKEGFDIPAHHWLRTTLRPLVTETLSERNVLETGVFAWQPIEGVLRAHLERRGNFGYHLWGLLILFLWMKYWSIEPPREPMAARPEMMSAAR